MGPIAAQYAIPFPNEKTPFLRFLFWGRASDKVAQAFQPAVSPTFLSAKLGKRTPELVIGVAGWKARDTADKNVCATLSLAVYFGMHFIF